MVIYEESYIKQGSILVSFCPIFWIWKKNYLLDMVVSYFLFIFHASFANLPRRREVKMAW